MAFTKSILVRAFFIVFYLLDIKEIRFINYI
nr:MAG TPA: hypothetical protein [Caudoviricetes sp.]